MATATKTYEYAVRDAGGALVSGTLEASSEAAVVSRLKGMGYAPVSLQEKKTSGLNTEISLPGSDRVSMKDLAVMSRQFATMVGAGLSLLRSLAILAEQSESKGLQKALADVRSRVEAGSSLSDGLTAHPKVFPPLMTNMVRAGEVGGFLDTVLLQIAESFEAEVKLRAKIKSAMTYPVVVFVMAILAVIGMLIFIVPVFTGMFADLGADLPTPTKVLVGLSSVMTKGAPVLLVLGVAGAVAWSRYKTHARVRDVVDPLKLKLPVFGNLFRKVAISRFTRNLGTMVACGVPILQSLEIVGQAAGNVVIQRATDDVAESVRQGRTISGPLAQHPVFPAMVVQMLAVGEDTGAVDSMLHKISDFYDQEVESTTEALTSLIEPLMIAVLGSVIGAMIVALYMPIFTVFNAIQ
ncbi:type II secretion system F family protein [Pseudokineococcus lusitanus]|uniref:Type IV pilus assembly protein PilC n=1 Tax=Pseudokineococcus lusitanus TaxID=763993 RepID=A0A3N1G9E5_9ACTN|nr:type II secretion system F family protein [Pseudokineococcus lusitanus]ROP26834.1 type IV pilus assembly protein PilC [Pseudokineococcus lusitanus]